MTKLTTRDFFRHTVIVLAALALPYTIFSIPAKEISQPLPAVEVGESYWILREYDGILGVFRDREPQPFEIYNVNISTLPDEDRELLRQGIVAHTDEELRGLLEDYTS
ncbi:MAG: hypothetical protein FWG82_04685 [Oscillospiraceae bacterium]|nr:hypothetical protein [Oscillospiraceae bacterium]